MKFTGCFLPIAVAVAAFIPGIASADVYTFSFSGTGFSGSGTLTATSVSNSYCVNPAPCEVVTSATGSINVNSFGLAPGGPGNFFILDYVPDNVLYPTGGAGALLDGNGLGFFIDGNPSDPMNIWGNGASDPNYTFAAPNVSVLGYNGVASTFSITLTPEPGLYGLLSLGLGGLVFAVRRRKGA